MKNEIATVIKRDVTTIGSGLLMSALQEEGWKGCSPVLCSAPVGLEPPYEVFDGLAVLRQARQPPRVLEVSGDQSWVTHRVFASPEDILTLQWTEILFRGLSSLPGPFAFELVGSGKVVHIQLAVPAQQEAGFLMGVMGIFPGLRLRRTETPFETHDSCHTIVVEELVPEPPYARAMTLVGDKNVSPLAIGYRVLGGLGKGEVGVYQVLLKPTDRDHDWHYNIQSLLEAEQRGAELQLLGGLDPRYSYEPGRPCRLDRSAEKKPVVDSATYAVVWRYAVWCAEERRAGFLDGMRVATGVVRFGNRPLRRLGTEALAEALGERDLARLVTRRRTHRPGIVITSTEVATLVHLPNEWVLSMFPEIVRRAGAEWRGPVPDTDAGQSEGPHPVPTCAPGDLLVGVNEYAGAEVPVVVPSQERLRHVQIVGTTGAGKTYSLEGMVLKDILAGQGVCVIDPHSDLAFDILSRLPEERLSDLVYLSFTEPGGLPSWNVFKARVPSGKLADDVVHAFRCASPTWGVRMESVIRQGAYLIHQLGGTFDDFHEILSKSDRGKELRARGLEMLDDNPEVRRFWVEEFPTYGPAHLDPVRYRLSRFLLDERIGEMFRHTDNDVDPRTWMDQRKVVVVNLAVGVLGGDVARFLGGLLCSQICRAAMGREELPEEERPPFFLYIDECQLLQSGALDEALSETRKHGLGLVLANQGMWQLGDTLKDATGGCHTRIVFRVGEGDAAHFRKALHGRVTPEQLTTQGVGQAYAAVGSHVASVRGVGSPVARVRDGRALAREICARTYRPVAGVARGDSSKPTIRATRDYDRI